MNELKNYMTGLGIAMLTGVLGGCIALGITDLAQAIWLIIR